MRLAIRALRAAVLVLNAGVAFANTGITNVAAAPCGNLNRDVRRILADRCFRCHGPQSAARKRGLRLDTLVIRRGEFGRTAYCQGTMPTDNAGRDHRSRGFSVWMAGGGVKPGFVHSATDDFGYNIVDGAVHVHDSPVTA